MPLDPIEVAPVPMHLASIEPGIELGGGKEPYRACESVYRLVRLQASDPVQEILPASEDREIAYVLALDDDIVINTKMGDAQNGAGMLIQHTNPVPYPIRHDGVLYASAQTFSGAGANSRVSVSAVYRK